MNKEPGRNDPCPCGSGLKFKRCHGNAAIQSTMTKLTRILHMGFTFEEIIKKQGGESHEQQAKIKDAMDKLTTGFIMYAPPYLLQALKRHYTANEAINSADIGELSAGLERCPDCGGYTGGKECMKCKKGS